MSTFNGEAYDDELDQMICDEYFPMRLDRFSFFDTDSECTDLLDVLEMYQESKYFLSDFLNAAFIKNMRDFFCSSHYTDTRRRIEAFFRKAALGRYYNEDVIEDVEVEAAFKFAFPFLTKEHCQILTGNYLYFPLIPSVVEGIKIFADLQEKNIPIAIWDSPSLFPEDPLPDTVTYMVRFFDRLQNENADYKRFQLESFLKLLADAPVGIGTQQVIEEFDLPKPGALQILEMAEKVSATAETRPIDDLGMSASEALYEKTGLIFSEYVTPEQQSDTLYLNLALLRKYNADYPYEVHEFSFSSNPDFYTEVLKAFDTPDKFFWAEPQALIKRVEDTVFAAAYGSQEDFMEIYQFKSKNALKRKVLLDAAPLVAAVRIAAAYGRCPSYPIFEGIPTIIEAFGLDSSYVLQRTCQYILDLGYPLIYETLKLARPTFEQIVDVAAEGTTSWWAREIFHYLLEMKHSPELEEDIDQTLAEYEEDEVENTEEEEVLSTLNVEDFLSKAADWMVDIKAYNRKYYRELMKKGKQEALMEVAKILFLEHNKYLAMRAAMWQKLDRDELEPCQDADSFTREQRRNEIEMQCRELIQEELNHIFLYD
ncbi:hypothetical protein [Megasphaera sp. DISK 18]|uniref:hypothetical protein n=1 Tax=Megasphaera sp. DISK 18 TaxID=1776081 RepID=UPI0008071AE5|nr:hypothetical protein [Megasphaera sp. DISK 18]OBZ32101.1 hypothetical protein A0U42_02830 [Megasphaera sp. DISK 18]